jgi:hypothetical protein
MSICFCIIDGKPGIAKLKNTVHYNTKTGDDYLVELVNNKSLLILSYKLAEICDDLKKPSNKYRVPSLRYAQISVLYTILEKVVGSCDYDKIFKILKDNELYDYFMKSATGIIRVYTDIGLRTKPKFKIDYGIDNIEGLSKLIDLGSAVKLNELISDWFNFKYMDDSDIISKIKKIK